MRIIPRDTSKAEVAENYNPIPFQPLFRISRILTKIWQNEEIFSSGTVLASLQFRQPVPRAGSKHSPQQRIHEKSRSNHQAIQT
jgi:hypothetical protein